MGESPADLQPQVAVTAATQPSAFPKPYAKPVGALVDASPAPMPWPEGYDPKVKYECEVWARELPDGEGRLRRALESHTDPAHHASDRSTFHAWLNDVEPDSRG
jgi:hypothetical protein